MVGDGSVDGVVQVMVVGLWVADGVVERVMSGHGQPPDLLKEQLQPPIHLDGQLLLPGDAAPHSAAVDARLEDVNVGVGWEGTGPRRQWIWWS